MGGRHKKLNDLRLWSRGIGKTKNHNCVFNSFHPLLCVVSAKSDHCHGLPLINLICFVSCKTIYYGNLQTNMRNMISSVSLVSFIIIDRVDFIVPPAVPQWEPLQSVVYYLCICSILWPRSSWMWGISSCIKCWFRKILTSFLVESTLCVMCNHLIGILLIWRKLKLISPKCK